MKNLQSQNQQGSSFLIVLLFIVVIGAVAYLGVSIASNDDNEVVSDTVVPAQVQEIENQEDLQGVEESLNDINLDDLDTTELDEAEADLL